MKAFEEISVQQLIARLREVPRRYGFFLGAGCSVGAGIPTASGVIEEVAKRLGRDPAGWRPLYADALQALGPLAVQEQFLSNLIADKRPARAHLELSALVEARWATTVFTTNFDRLIENALALGTRECLVVNHRCIADDLTRKGPLNPDAQHSYVVKLHGDYLLPAMSNQPWQVAQLADGFDKLFTQWALHHGLVVVGYGSEDAGIRGCLEEAARRDGLPLGLVWVVRHGDEIPGWVQDLQRMRQTPWIDVLWVHDAGDLFASLRSELAPATSPNIGLEDKRQRDISRVGAAALVCLRRLRNIKDGKTEKVRHDEKWFLGKDLDNYSAIIEDVPEEEIRRDHERVERAIRGRILLREDLPSQQELDEVIGELETLLRKYHQPVDDR